MNERIRELYNTVAGNDKLGFDSYLAEKFAELLILECIDILMEPRYIMDKSQKLSRYNEGWVNGRLLGIEHIEKHFGVES